jgi:GH25 family lysozyme M1 (1,4-beta-N-acetylmuramidase)
VSLLGIDISHYQGNPNEVALKAGGLSFVIEKATQGTSFLDPTYVVNRREALAAGLVNGGYHFAGGYDPVAEATFYCATVGQLNPGELAVLDFEIPMGDPVPWCLAWLKTTEARLGVKPLIYLNQSTVNGFDWSPVVAGDFGLWLAKYDQLQSVTAVKWWNGEAIKQYFDKGTVGGVAGEVDQDVFFGDLAALLKYGKAGAGKTPAPVPAPRPAPRPAPAAPVFDVRNFRAHIGATGTVFAHLQAWANRFFPAYAHIGPISPSYGPQTAAFLAEFCARQRVKSDGRDIGPQTALLLYRAGFRG